MDNNAAENKQWQSEQQEKEGEMLSVWSIERKWDEWYVSVVLVTVLGVVYFRWG